MKRRTSLAACLPILAFAALVPSSLSAQTAADTAGASGGPGALENMSAMTLVLITRAMAQRPVPPEARRADVTILDVFGNAASVRVDAAQWVDYLHLGRFNGQWRIVNVLWEMRPGGGS